MLRSLSSSLWACTHTSWWMGRVTSVVMVRWKSMEWVLHGGFSHIGKTITTKNRL
jgi:hypothetical protein